MFELRVEEDNGKWHWRFVPLSDKNEIYPIKGRKPYKRRADAVEAGKRWVKQHNFKWVDKTR